MLGEIFLPVVYHLLCFYYVLLVCIGLVSWLTPLIQQQKTACSHWLLSQTFEVQLVLLGLLEALNLVLIVLLEHYCLGQSQ